MPLYAKAERRFVRPAHGLDQAVLGERLGLQTIGKAGDSLPMQRINHDLVAPEPIAQLAAQKDWVDWAVGLVERDVGPGAMVLVAIDSVNRLVQAAAKCDVQLLKAAANGEEWLLALDRGPDERK